MPRVKNARQEKQKRQKKKQKEQELGKRVSKKNGTKNAMKTIKKIRQLNKNSIVAIILAISLGLGGCTFADDREMFGLPLCPPKPVYPRLTDNELACLEDATYFKVVDNVAMRDAHINELTAHCQEM